MLSFVLSGGGSRGALQVGALQALLEEGIRPDMVVGTSIGAINSVWFAADPTLQGVETLRKLYATLMVDDFFPGGNKFAALNLVLQMPHLFANDRFRQLLEENLPVKTFGELALPCFVVATDLDSGENRVFGDNPDDRIIDGLMSSTAMTPLHPSWEVDGHVYADGGLGAMLPVREAVERGATEIIGLNLAAQLQSAEERRSTVDTLTHVVDLLLNSQVKSQVEAIKRIDYVSLDVIDLNTEQYQNMRFGDNLAESMAYGYQLLREHLTQVRPEHEVLPRLLERKWWRKLPVEATIDAGEHAVMLPPVVHRSLPRRAAQTAQLYRHAAVALAKQGPSLVMTVPRSLPVVGPVVRGGEAVWGRLSMCRVVAPVRLVRAVVRPSVPFLAPTNGVAPSQSI